MNWAIKIISKTLMTKITHISWGGYDKGFYGKGKGREFGQGGIWDWDGIEKIGGIGLVIGDKGTFERMGGETE